MPRGRLCITTIFINNMHPAAVPRSLKRMPAALRVSFSLFRNRTGNHNSLSHSRVRLQAWGGISNLKCEFQIPAVAHDALNWNISTRNLKLFLKKNLLQLATYRTVFFGSTVTYFCLIRSCWLKTAEKLTMYCTK